MLAGLYGLVTSGGTPSGWVAETDARGFGMTGSSMVVINPPHGSILAVGAGEKRPHVIDDALSVATVMSATGSFDHRAIDGADAALLMQAFRDLVEQPMTMLA